MLRWAVLILLWGCASTKSPSSSKNEDLKTLLEGLTFLHKGIVKSTDVFTHRTLSSAYTEPENVTVVDKSWTNPGGKLNYLYKVEEDGSLTTPPLGMRSAVALGERNPSARILSSSSKTDELKTLLEGLTFLHKGVVKSTDVYTHQSFITHYTEPENVTVVDKQWSNPGGKLNYLYKLDEDGNPTTPPLGMRSAVALGGIATGSTELRADGTFHEWMIMNASPAGAAKIGKVPYLQFNVGVNSSLEDWEFWVLQTHPEPPTFEGPDIQAVQALEYSGSHPVAKLKVVDDRIPLNITLYAYSTYSVGDMMASAVPAIAFTLVINNPTDRETRLNLAMQLQGFESRSDRSTLQGGQKATPYSVQKEKTTLFCQGNCARSSNKCLSWTYNEVTQDCSFYDVITLNSYNENMTSGILGVWTQETIMGADCVTYHTPGQQGPSGNITSCLVHQEDKPESGNNKKKMTFDDGTPGLYGSNGLETQLGPQESKTLTYVMAWNYPHRDFIANTLGNRYSLFYPTHQSAATYMMSNLVEIVRNISDLHKVFTESSLEPFLQDIYINSLSHIRSAMWFADGRWRQWEAHDCTNIDSVHNDGERHIPYITFFPDSTRNKLEAWAKGQITLKANPNYGMIQEQLRCGCGTLEPGSVLDTPCGRVMSDVSSMFIVYVLELYKWANDKNTLMSLWPNVKLAAEWHINVSTKMGVPEHLVNTYDILGQEQYDLCAFNSAFHMLAMAAAKELAVAMGDSNFAQQCDTAFSAAQSAIDNLQWNETAGYYNSYSNLSAPVNPGALMTDTFYSQVLAFSLDLGVLVKNQSRLLSHMKQELKINDSPYGMLVQTGRFPYPGPPQDNAVWLMGNPNWATINIHLNQDIKQAMSVANKTLNWWREEVNDLWNIPALEGGLGYGMDGLPWASSHYGYFMSSWHIIFALSGQKADLPNGKLEFDAKDTSDSWLYPVLLPGVAGYVSNSGNKYTVGINLGQVTINTKLSVKGVTYSGSYPVILKAGDKISWP